MRGIIEKFAEKEIEKEKIDYTNMKSFKKMLKANYEHKSLNLLTYEVMNLKTLVNKRTGQKMAYFEHDYFTLTQNNKYRIAEEKKGVKLDEYYNHIAKQNIAKVKYLDSVNSDKKSLFLTFTLPSEYHFFKSHKKVVKNPHCKFNSINDSVEHGAIELNKIYRYFYNAVKKSLKRANIIQEMPYVRVFEPHNENNITLHLHACLWFLNQEQKEIIEHCYNLTIKKFDLKQAKLEEVNTSATTYVTKYILKNNSNSFYNQYKAYFGQRFRFFTASKYNHLTQKELSKLYVFYNINFPDKISELREKGDSIYKFLEDEFLDNRFKIEKEQIQFCRLDTKLIKKRIEQEKKKQETLINELKIISEKPQNLSGCVILQKDELDIKIYNFLKSHLNPYLKREGKVYVKVIDLTNKIEEMERLDYLVNIFKLSFQNYLKIETETVINKIVFNDTKDVIYERNLWQKDSYSFDEIDEIVKQEFEISEFLEQEALKTKYRQDIEKKLLSASEGLEIAL